MTSTMIPITEAPTWRLTDRLTKSRLIAGLGQTELADALGISRGSVSNYERGVKVPTRGTIILWAMRCGVSWEWLMTGTTEPGDHDPFDVRIQPLLYKAARAA